MQTLISVVIPLFNKQGYIINAIESVLRQTITDFEIVVVDDCSTDSSPELVKSLTDPRIKLVQQQKNCGVAAARNRGIVEAKSEWVALLDADDIWKEDYLETIVDLMQIYPNCGAYATSFEYLNLNTNRSYMPKVTYPTGWSGVVEDYFAACQYSQIFHGDSIVINREAILRIGGFPEDFTLGEDNYTWVNLFLNYPIAFINIPKIIYRIGIKNQMTSKQSDYKFLYWLIEIWKTDDRIEKYRPTFRLYVMRWVYYVVRQRILCFQEGDVTRKWLKILLLEKIDKNLIKIVWYLFWSFFPHQFKALVNIKQNLKQKYSQ